LPVFLVLLAASAAGAQGTTPLTSNRPGISDSEALVDRGAIQVESGIQFSEEPPGQDPAWAGTFGQLTLRIGVRKHFEFFTGWDGLSLDRTHIDGETRIVAGGDDLRIGAKFALLDEARHGITLAVAPAWSFPVGADEFSSSSNDGSLRVLWARSLPRDWSVSGNFLFTRTSDEGTRLVDRGVMVGATKALSSTVSAFGELSGTFAAEHPDAWTMDAGMAWVAKPNLQWDISAGHTFHDRGDDWFVSAGISVRRP
jgi:hypothetical protein